MEGFSYCRKLPQKGFKYSLMRRMCQELRGEILCANIENSIFLGKSAGFMKIFWKFFDLYWEEAALIVASLFAVGILWDAEFTTLLFSWLCVLIVISGVGYSVWRKFQQSAYESERKKQEEQKDRPIPIFLSDEEIKSEKEDVLGVAEDARHFGERVLNGGADNAMVFGLDAAWGSGKSSFLNLCRGKVWETKENRENVAVFTFRPVLFDVRKQDMAEIFIREFFSFLKEKDMLIGDLESGGRKLARLVSNMSVGSGLFGINFRIPKESSDSVLDSIRRRIKLLPKKIIVIVDDLDRLYAEEVKAILGVVRDIFNIPKISFVLCYDTSNINSFEMQKKTVHIRSFGNNRTEGESQKNIDALDGYSRAEHDPDNERLNAYFEKIVQVKKTLIPNREKLKSFFIEKSKEIFEGSNESNCKRFLEGAEYFFREENYPKYAPFIGDIRKIKRILNFIYVSNFAKSIKSDFSQRDIDSKYLLQLVLIYINHPCLFRKIYTEETGGSFGFFSVVPNHGKSSENSSKFKNSSKFLEFLNTVSAEQRFLLEELFLVKEFGEGSSYEKNQYEEMINSLEFQRYSPFFNGGYFLRENLNDYLKIIYDGQLLPLWQYDNFHLNKIRELEQKSVREVFDETLEYDEKFGEKPRDMFFERAQTKNIPTPSAERIIEYITRNLSKYSMVSEFSGVCEGIRSGLVYRLLWMLELRGWKDKRGESYENSDENVAVLAEKIFGSDKYPSIADTLLESGGDPILSVNDATRFIYACTDTRSQSLFNVRRSLQNYAKNYSINIMEVLSRKAFLFFHRNLIQKKKNFLRDIADMDESLLFGDFSEAIRKTFTEKGKSYDEEMEKIKNGLAVALVYRFARDEENSMGLYLFDTSSSETIAEIMRGYLFDVCFDVDADARNAELFINFALASFEDETTTFREWVPNISFLEKVFGSDRLRNYWRKYGESVKESGRKILSGVPDKKVVTYNYTATYKDDMEKFFEKLDEWASGSSV